MKSILIIPSWYKSADSPSAGSFFEEQAKLMAKAYEICLYVLERVFVEDIDGFPEERPQRSEVIPGLYLYRLKYPQSHILSPEDNLKKQIFYGKKGFEFLLRDRGRGFNLIHAQATFPAGIIARHISILYKTPYIVTEHFGPFNPDFLHSSFTKNEMKQALECANMVLSVSYHLRQQILMQNIYCNPIVVGNMVDDELFCIDFKPSGSIVKLLCVAYYPGYIKDLDNLFSALSLLKDRQLNFHMIVIGGGEPQGGNTGKNILFDLKEKYNLGDEITIIGSCSRTQMKEHMQSCDFYISSSIAETFGVCICEAMLCGKPVVLTNNGGSADFVNQKNSITVEIHDPQQLADAIIMMVNSRSEYDSFYIRNHIVEKYGKQAFFKRLSTIYDNVINLL